jgi:hypothetical protein
MAKMLFCEREADYYPASEFKRDPVTGKLVHRCRLSEVDKNQVIEAHPAPPHSFRPSYE